jgi:hypothetical protein
LTVAGHRKEGNGFVVDTTPATDKIGAMKTYRRRFQTAIDLNLYTRLAQEVIDGIENDTINVLRPDNEDALVEVYDTDGAILLDARATLPVSVREWLPVVCQFIRWESECDLAAIGRDRHDQAVAYYRSNAYEVLWPFWGAGAAGPGALVAGIVLRREHCVSSGIQCTAAECDRLRFVLAHELVHAFHAMRFAVPAFMNWRLFRREVLGEGTRCDILGSNHEDRSGFLDSYGTELELAEVLQFWPSQGKRWFETWQEPPTR